MHLLCRADVTEQMNIAASLQETEFVRELKEIKLNDLVLQDRLLDIHDEKETLLNRLVQME